MMFYLTRIPFMGTFVSDNDGRLMARVMDHVDAEVGEKIVRALILQEVIDHRTEVWKSIAEKWQDGSKL